MNAKSKKGRNAKLIAMRDEQLVYMYFYLSEIKRFRFDDVSKMLSFEFFLSEDRIMTIIRKNINRLEELKSKPISQVKKPKLSKEELENLVAKREIA